MPTITNAEPHCRRTRFASSTWALSARPLSCSSFSRDGVVDMRRTIHHSSRAQWQSAAQPVGMGLARQVSRRRRAHGPRADGRRAAAGRRARAARAAERRAERRSRRASRFPMRSPTSRRRRRAIAPHARAAARSSISSPGSPATTPARPISSRARAMPPRSRACSPCATRAAGRSCRSAAARRSSAASTRPRARRRPRGRVSLDLGALAGVHEVDATSRLARIGAGTLGPRARGRARAARPHAAPLPAVVRVLDARRLARDARRRSLRDRPDAHRRSLPRVTLVTPARHARDALPHVASVPPGAISVTAWQ